MNISDPTGRNRSPIVGRLRRWLRTGRFRSGDIAKHATPTLWVRTLPTLDSGRFRTREPEISCRSWRVCRSATVFIPTPVFELRLLRLPERRLHLRHHHA
jgi:hypothetical protein